MHAVILAGGIGKRLRPITDYVPKPLVPILDAPILQWQVRYLKKFGIDDITVCTGYRTQQIRRFLEAKSDFGINIQVSEEKTPLGTGGAIKKACRHIDGPFFVLNGDVITDIDLSAIKSPNTIAGIEMRTQFGTLCTTKNQITAFDEKKPIKNVWMNAGIYHLSEDIAGMLPKKGDIERTTFPLLAGQKRLHITKFRDARWFSIDSHKDISECAKVIADII